MTRLSIGNPNATQNYTHSFFTSSYYTIFLFFYYHYLIGMVISHVGLHDDTSLPIAWTSSNISYWSFALKQCPQTTCTLLSTKNNCKYSSIHHLLPSSCSEYDRIMILACNLLHNKHRCSNIRHKNWKWSKEKWNWY